MSVEAAQKFLARIEKEDSLRTQLYINGVADLEKMRAFAHGKGFILTDEELKVALQSYKPQLASGGNMATFKQLVG